MKRREFITLLGGAAAAWPVVAPAQQAMPRIGLVSIGADPSNPVIFLPFLQQLRELGYVEGRKQIISQANRHRVPAVYPYPFFSNDDGLISYGVDLADSFRSAGVYVDRILRGEKPAELPVQAPTKFELVINLKTAKSLGLDVPVHLQQLADEVIE
jgi:ABC-type uncharacterized transport system substrate-binding protein